MKQKNNKAHFDIEKIKKNNQLFLGHRINKNYILKKKIIINFINFH